MLNISRYEEVIRAIIRPPRAEYTMEDLGKRRLLRMLWHDVTMKFSYNDLFSGPTPFQFCGRTYQRTDLIIENARRMKLYCSHWEPIDTYVAAMLMISLCSYV